MYSQIDIQKNNLEPVVVVSLMTAVILLLKKHENNVPVLQILYDINGSNNFSINLRRIILLQEIYTNMFLIMYDKMFE